MPLPPRDKQRDVQFKKLNSVHFTSWEDIITRMDRFRHRTSLYLCSFGISVRDPTTPALSLLLYPGVYPPSSSIGCSVRLDVQSARALWGINALILVRVSANRLATSTVTELRAHVNADSEERYIYFLRLRIQVVHRRALHFADGRLDTHNVRAELHLPYVIGALLM